MLYGRRLDQSLQHVDGSRYALVHAVAKRARQITLWLTADPAELRAEAAPPPAPGELTSRDPVALAEAEILDGEVKVRWDPDGLDEAALLDLDELETDPLLLEGLGDDDESGLEGDDDGRRADPGARAGARGRRDRRRRGRVRRRPGRRRGARRAPSHWSAPTRSRRSPSKRSRSPTRTTTRTPTSRQPRVHRTPRGSARHRMRSRAAGRQEGSVGAPNISAALPDASTAGPRPQGDADDPPARLRRPRDHQLDARGGATRPRRRGRRPARTAAPRRRPRPSDMTSGCASTRCARSSGT